MEQRGLEFTPHSVAVKCYASGQLKKKLQEVADLIELEIFLDTHTAYYVSAAAACAVHVFRDSQDRQAHGMHAQEIEETEFTPPREAATPGGHPGAPIVRFELPCYPEIGSLYAQAHVEVWGGWEASFTPHAHAKRVEAILYCVQVRLSDS